MVSAVSSRPNHYATLGLSPSASHDEIGRAFAREIGMFRPFAPGGVAQVSIAYETLRDPIKRRDYDASLGLRPEPEPSPALMALRGGMRFIGSAPVFPVERPIHDRLPPPPAAMKPQPRPEPPAEPRTASFIAASLRRRPDPEAKPCLDSPIRVDRLPQRAEDLRLGDAEDRRVEWTRPAMAAGALVAAVVLLGALAGWKAGHGDEPQALQPAVTAALPPAPRLPATIVGPPAPAVDVMEKLPRRVARAAVATPRIKRPVASPQASVAEDSLSEETQSAPSQPVAVATEEAATASPAVETVAALPLPNAVIARTIERIGYACGRVASTSAVAGGSSGAYKVTCTSGLSYQATPVRGRYRFRRLSSH